MLKPALKRPYSGRDQSPALGHLPPLRQAHQIGRFSQVALPPHHSRLRFPQRKFAARLIQEYRVSEISTSPHPWILDQCLASESGPSQRLLRCSMIYDHPGKVHTIFQSHHPYIVTMNLTFQAPTGLACRSPLTYQPFLPHQTLDTYLMMTITMKCQRTPFQ